MNPIADLKALQAYLASSLATRLSSSTKRGISQTLVIGIIIGVMIVGGVLVYIVVTSTGATTTSPYP